LKRDARKGTLLAFACLQSADEKLFIPSFPYSDTRQSKEQIEQPCTGARLGKPDGDFLTAISDAINFTAVSVNFPQVDS